MWRAVLVFDRTIDTGPTLDLPLPNDRSTIEVMTMSDDDSTPQAPEADDQDTPRHSRFRGKDGVTAEDRDRPYPQSIARTEKERKIRAGRPDQLPLFTDLPASPTDSIEPSDLSKLTAHASVTLARSWYRHSLERARRPRNTIESYSYDLTVLENIIGPKRINAITGTDIARYLGDASSKSTRKRRLTSARRFFRYLIDDAKVLTYDPTDGYYPHQIRSREPRPLFENEQETILAAARKDEEWSATAIWLMLHAGLTRSELLALDRDHIDRTNPEHPIVHIYYDDVAKHGKERALLADETFSELYDAFLDARDPLGRLFPVGPQAINGMVDRVRSAAGIAREVTPQILRHTFAVNEARKGSDQQTLLRMLGLADDPRNRRTVASYIKAAAPPVNASVDPVETSANETDTDISNAHGTSTEI